MRGLTDTDMGYVAVDLHQHLGIDLTPKLMARRSWRWVMARAIRLTQMDTETRKELHREL